MIRTVVLLGGLEETHNYFRASISPAGRGCPCDFSVKHMHGKCQGAWIRGLGTIYGRMRVAADYAFEADGLLSFLASIKTISRSPMIFSSFNTRLTLSNSSFEK